MMFANTASDNGRSETWPLQTQTVHYARVVYLRDPYRHTLGNEPIGRMSDEFSHLVETVLERKRRISYKQKKLAMSRLRRFGLPPLAEAMFHKPTFVRRACGGRWRVMTP